MLTGLPSVAGLGVWKIWAWLAFSCWVDIARPFNLRVSNQFTFLFLHFRSFWFWFDLFWVFWVASYSFSPWFIFVVSWELQGESNLCHLTGTKSLMRGLWGVGRDPLRLPVEKKMNLVSGFISTRIIYLFTFLPLIVPRKKPERDLSSPQPPPLCNHAAIIGFYEWKFLYFQECGGRVKLKPRLQFATLCGGKVSQQMLCP